MTHRELLEIIEAAQKRTRRLSDTMGAYIYDDPLRAIAEVLRERLGDAPPKGLTAIPTREILTLVAKEIGSDKTPAELDTMWAEMQEKYNKGAPQ